MRKLLLTCFLILCASPTWAADFAVVQQAIRSGTGTQDFTSSATFGGTTPKGALFFVTSGTVNGTIANHALIGIGATDGTNHAATASFDQDGIALGTTIAGRRANATSCLVLLDESGVLKIKATCTLIADGIRLDVTTGTAGAYLVTAVLMGGSGVSSVAVGTVTTPANITPPDDNATVNVGFEPTFVIAFSPGGDIAFNDTNSGTGQVTFGFVQNDGTNPHPQYGANLLSATGVATSAVVASIESTTVSRALPNSTDREVEIETFTSTGFDASTRAAASAATIGYMAVKLSGLSAKVMAIDATTSAGSQITSGIGFTSQFALLATGSNLAYGSRTTDGTGDAFGVSALTAAAQYSHAITSLDGQAVTTDAESVVHDRAVFLRRGGATFANATLTGFGSGTMELNFVTPPASGPRKWAGLFISAPANTRHGSPLLFQ